MTTSGHELDDKTFIREWMYDSDATEAERYRDLVVGGDGWLRLIKYEAATLLAANLPGALGLILRRILYRGLFARAGEGIVIGKGVTIRHPHKIKLGNGVVLDDYSVVDARGAGDKGIVIGDDVIVGRGASLLAKNGFIEIAKGSNIGAASCIVSRGGVRIGKSALIGGESHISGGMYHTSDRNKPIMEQGIYTRGPIVIGDNVWFGMKVGVLDGVNVGEGSVIGAGAIVTKDVPNFTVAAGVPAEKVSQR